MNMKGVLNIVMMMLAATLLVLPVSGAFAVTGITPDSGINTGPVFVTNLSGTDLPVDASVTLMLAGQPNITGQFITWVDPARITCVFDIEEKLAGDWDVVVVNNTDSSESVLFAGFSIANPAPDVTGIVPSTGINNGIITITGLSGSNFLPGAQVNLTNGISTLPGTSVNVISGNLIQCQFNINGALPGAWDVVVTNYDGQSDTLPGGFSIAYPPPSVSSISPLSGKNNEVVGITNLAGSHFMAGATVQLVKENETNITTINGPIVEATKILCFFDLNAKAVGPWDVVVTNTDGQYAVLPDGFTIFYPQGPTVSGIAPAAGQNDGPVNITAISGTGFQPGAMVALLKGGETDIQGTGILVSNSTSIGCSFDITGAATGAWDVRVTNNDGQSAVLPAAFTVQNPAPTLNGIVPDNGFNAGPVAVTNLSGTGFLPGAAVALTKGQADIPATMVNVITPQMISCSVDLSGATTGLWSVVITNPDTQSAVLANSFTVAYPPPSADAINPVSGTTGQIIPANITGNNFLAGATVTLVKAGESNVSAMVLGVIPSKIACSFDLSGAISGPWSVVVTNPDGKESLISNGFEVINPAPSVTSTNPSVGVNNGISGVIELSGTGFLEDAAVTLKKAGEADIGAMGAPVVVNNTTIFCFFDLTNAGVGAWDVVVTNTDLQSGTLPAGFFISYPAAPQVTSITPATGVNTGMVGISSLTGTGFENGAEVVLKKTGEANITGMNVMVLPPAQITCEFNLAGAAEGPWDIVVINDDGQSGILPGGFQVTYPAPQITGIAPLIGINNGPVSITNLSGVYFRSPATVKLTRLGEPDIPGSSVAVVNAGKITCSFALAGAAAGPWNLVVTNPDGQYAIATNIFTVENPAPSVSKITPNRGANDSTVFISALNGTGFLPGATVQLTKNGQIPIPATGVNVVSATKINCTLNLTGKATGKWNVVVKNADNKTGTLSNAFTITPPPPIPNFTASPVFGTAPLKVQFTDLSANAPYIWSWNFGDGSSVIGFNQTNPVHIYNKPGVYNVTLLVRNEWGDEAQITKNAYITVVVTPVASFTAKPLSGPAPLLVQFTDTSDGDPVKWLWKFGDGGYSFDKNPYHLYKNPGFYTVTLMVSNKAGSDTETITNMIEVTSLPVAGFTANITSGSSPLAVQFKDTSTGSPTAWLWKFGDGGTSAEQNPVHVFTSSGTYSVQLNVSNAEGNSTETKEGYIVVGQGLHADFEYTTSNPENTAPLSVAFTDRSSGKVLKWTWRFGDGYISNDRNPIHNYPLPGTYDVTLSVTGLSGSESMTKTITVKSPLKADFVAEPTTGSAPLTVMLTDISIGTPTERTWVISRDSGNLVILYPGLKEQIYTINEPGLYKVELEVKDAFGESDVKSISDYINVLPFPE